MNDLIQYVWIQLPDGTVKRIQRWFYSNGAHKKWFYEDLEKMYPCCKVISYKKARQIKKEKSINQ